MWGKFRTDTGWKPVLPSHTKIFTLPFGSRVTNIEVLFSNPVKKSLINPIIPSPEPQIISSTAKSALTTEKFYEDNLESSSVYPSSQFEYRLGAGLCDNEHVLYISVFLYPVQYEQDTNSILFSREAEILISYKLPKTPIVFPEEYNFLIITPKEFAQEFINPVSNYDVSFIDYKNKNGVSTKLVTIEEIYTGIYFEPIGKDEQEKIKYFIKNAIETWGVTNLLLVGGSLDNKEYFPVRNVFVPSGRYEEYFPSDLYYADIYDKDFNFSHWDDDGDGKHAEYTSHENDMNAVDMYPDIYLGKLPCNSIDELRTVIKKILYYEKHNKMTKSILQIGVDTFPGDPESINEGEYANQKVSERLPGYSTIQLWASNNQLTKFNIAQGFNSNVDFVDFSGHGSWGSWATHDTEKEKVWLPADSLISPYTGWLYIDYEMYAVRNTKKLPVIMFNACSCHKYTESKNCIGWKSIYIDGGGIASFGTSGIGYESYGSYEIKRVMGWMEVHIFEELFITKNLGQTWSNVITGYINSFISSNDWDGADYKTVLELSMFGDPTLTIEDGPEPKTRFYNYRWMQFF